MTNSKLRGHDIESNGDIWVYSDTKEPVQGNYINRPCNKCGEAFTKEGHDACLKTLPGVMNACCGHGSIPDTYVQFLDGFSIHGVDAKLMIDLLKKYKKDVK